MRRLPCLGDCGRKECCGSWLSVRLDYPSQQLVDTRVVARAGPGPLAHCPRLGCWRCKLAAHRPGNCCPPCCRYAAQHVCMPVNRGDCEFQFAAFGVGLARQCCQGGQLSRPAVPGALPQSHSCPLWLSTVGAALLSLCCKPSGSHRLWPPSESVVTPAPPAIAGVPDMPKTRPQPPLRYGWGYTFWSSRTLQPIGRPRCNL